MSMRDELGITIDDNRAARERERQRYDLAKALFVRLMTENIVIADEEASTYRDIACQAVTAADEFLQQFYEPEPTTILPPYEG